MRVEEIAEIRQLALFREMADAGFDALMRATYLQTFPPHVTIIEEGDPPAFLPVLIEGTVELFASWTGRQTTIDLLQPVTTIVLAASISEKPYLMSGRTLTKCRIALIPSEDVRRVFRADPDFAAAIATELALRFRGAIRQIKNLKLRTSAERLANLLLRQSAAQDGAAEFCLPVEKRLLASLLGMTPENLSRAFATLRQYGVAVEGARVRLESKADLRRFARPTEHIDFDGEVRPPASESPVAAK